MASEAISCMIVAESISEKHLRPVALTEILNHMCCQWASEVQDIYHQATVLTV